MGRLGRASGKRGFTMVELLAVMAIISILAALLLPAINKARSEARSLNCKSNLRQIGLALSMYSSNFSGWMPIGGDALVPADAGQVATDLMWDGETVFANATQRHYAGLGLLTLLDDKFIGDAAVLFCPDESGLDIGAQMDVLRNRRIDRTARCSYIYRQLDCRRPGDEYKGRFGSLGMNPGRDQTSDPVGDPGSEDDDRSVKAIVADRNFLGERTVGDYDPTIRVNHNGVSINVLFEDGHVETLLNTNMDTADDLRLNCQVEAAGSNKTGTAGYLEDQFDRVWVLYDEGV